MQWWPVALIVLAVIGLIVFNVLTGAGSRMDCAAKDKQRNKKHLKDGKGDQ